MDHETRTTEARRFFLQQFVGFSMIPEDHVQEIYAKALLICAKGDGVLHDDERAWVRGYFASTGAPDHVLALIETYQGDDDINDVLALDERTARMAARNIVFDALRVCAADDELSSRERDTIFGVGVKMGLTHREVEQVEAAYRVYTAALENKMTVLFPHEAPPF